MTIATADAPADRDRRGRRARPRRHRRRRAAHARSCRRLTLSERAGGRGGAEGREPPAHGVVQDPRRAEQARRAGGRLQPRRVCGERRQPRPGAGVRRSRARRAVRGLHARRARRSRKVEAAQALGATVRWRAPRSTSASRRRSERAARGRHGLRPPVRRSRRRRRPGHARARAARRRARISPRSSCRSVAAGCPAASRSRSSRRGPDVEVVGVQVETVAAVSGVAAGGQAGRRAGGPDDRGRHRGQAARRAHACRSCAQWVDDVVVVAEDDVAEAMVLLMEKAKLVVEGAGAVGVAALLAARRRRAREGATVVVLSGGNVDAGLLAVGRAPPRDRGRAAPRASSRACRTGPARSPRLLALRRRGGREHRRGRRTCARASTCTSARPAVQLDHGDAAREHAEQVLARCARAARSRVMH